MMMLRIDELMRMFTAIDRELKKYGIVKEDCCQSLNFCIARKENVKRLEGTL